MSFSLDACMNRIVHTYINYSNPYDPITAGFCPHEEDLKKLDIVKAMKACVKGKHLDILDFILEKTSFRLWKSILLKENNIEEVLQKAISIAARNNDMRKIEEYMSIIIPEGCNRQYRYMWNIVMEAGADKNNKELIEKAIENGADDYESCIYEATKNNDVSMIEYLTNKTTIDESLLLSALEGACAGGHMTAVLYYESELIHGYSYSLEQKVSTWKDCLLHAIGGGNMTTVEYFTDKILRINIDIRNKDEDKFYDDTRWVNMACRFGNLALVDYFVRVFGEKRHARSTCLLSAVIGGNNDIIDLFLSKYTESEKRTICWGELIEQAERQDHFDLEVRLKKLAGRMA